RNGGSRARVREPRHTEASLARLPRERSEPQATGEGRFPRGRHVPAARQARRRVARHRDRRAAHPRGRPLNVAQLLVKCLENEGVRHVFGIPGEETLALNAALADSGKIRFVLTRHEQGAAFMADVYGRLSSYPGVCLATLGPGATNLMTGIADAQLDRAPLVAITGQAGLERAHKESHQYIDVVQMLRPVTKWNARIETADAVPEMVRKAFRLARLEKPGATHLELPEDVAAMPLLSDLKPMPVRRTTYPQAGPGVLESAADLLCHATRPLVLVGKGRRRMQA